MFLEDEVLPWDQQRQKLNLPTGFGFRSQGSGTGVKAIFLILSPLKIISRNSSGLFKKISVVLNLKNFESEKQSLLNGWEKIGKEILQLIV